MDKKTIFNAQEEEDNSNGGQSLSNIIERAIEKIYFDPSHPQGFGDPYLLYKAVKKEVPGVRVKDVRRWLAKQPVYTLHREVVLKFPKRKVIVRGPFIQYQADLLDTQGIAAENDRCRYILTVIDCFSRKAAAIPILQKKAPIVAEALQTAFKYMGGAPLKLQTDEGTEFKNKYVHEMLQKLGCVRFSTHQDVKASIVERFNRYLRTRMQKALTYFQSLRFVDFLPKLMEAYNNRVHSAIGVSPNEVTHKNAHEIFEYQYRSYLSQKAKRKKFKFGDTVRITTFRPRFYKKNMQKNFTTHLFTITDVLDTNPNTYRLVDKGDSESIEGSFYENELQKVLHKDEKLIP